MNVLVFAGTTEGRHLAQWLAQQKIPHLISVATDYGQTLLPQEAQVQAGRLSQEEMCLLLDQGFTQVVDATHPYATQVTAQLKSACQERGTPYLRLLRDQEGTPENPSWLTVPDTPSAVETLKGLEGNILLTLGAKEVGAYASLAERCYPRVLPLTDSLERCLQAGFPPKHILCLQGPFTQEMNRAILNQYHIQILVTKFTGTTGGFPEKVAAAQDCHCTLLVIAPPQEEEGHSLAEIQGVLGQGLTIPRS